MSEVENSGGVKGKLQEERDHGAACVKISTEDQQLRNTNHALLPVRPDAAPAPVCSVLTQREADLIAHSQELTEGHGVVGGRQAQLVHPGGRRGNTGIIGYQNQSCVSSQRWESERTFSGRV